MDLVSVIIPTFNREKTIKRSIDSVLRQTYTNLELIIVDDYSSDNTQKIISEYTDDRIKYIKLDKNYGACFARNIGINNSIGKYIAFQDSDDVWHLDKLEKQILLIKQNNIDACFCNFEKHLEDDEVVGIFPNIEEGIISYDILLKKNIISTQCLIVDRKCFKDIKFDEKLPRLQDWDIGLQLAKKYVIYHINESLVDMYVQRDSISKNPKNGIVALQIIRKKNESEYKKNEKALYNWYIYMGNYVLDSKQNPSSYYKKALNIKFNIIVFFKYILSKLHIIIPIYKFLKKI